ncbi:MAG TPA: twin transmembrane helix small protein [Dongiaceae bacterium]|jgi:VIT1/CCC1 family predicted Fe2+/Mn2+ transporter|nr:twin transmembrane helix small protein [Dongiaceae bacterium]
MRFFFLGLGGLFAVATLVILLVGVTAMGKGGAFNDKYANKLMRMRVIFQGLAIACFFLGLVVH